MRLDLDPSPTWKSSDQAPSSGSAEDMTSRKNEEDGPLTADDLFSPDHDGDGDGDDAALLPPSPLPPVTSPRVQRSATLAGRRRVPAPPKRINTGLSSTPTTAADSAFPTTEEEDEQASATPPLPHDHEPKTPTPTTADFRTMLGTYIAEDEEVDRLVEMSARVSRRREDVARRDERSKVERVLASASPMFSALSTAAAWEGSGVEEIQRLGCALRVKQRLYPAVLLLSHILTSAPSGGGGNVGGTAEANAAAQYAYLALQSAREAEGGAGDVALRGRCAYYVALAECLLANKKRDDGLSTGRWSAGSWGRRVEDAAPVVEYFEMACSAEGSYEEGRWAVEWVDYLKGGSEDKGRPGSSGSWRGWLWDKILRREGEGASSNGVSEKKSMGRQDVREYYANRETSANNDDHSPGIGERLSFLSSSSDSANNDDDEAKPATYIPPSSSTSLPSSDGPSTPFHSSSAEPSPSLLPEPVTSPNTSPRAKSVAFEVSPTAKRTSIYERRHSRRPSLLARVTGRERRPSELERAEEGESPFKGTFEGDGDGGGGFLKWRKGRGSVDGGVGDGMV